MLRTVLAGLRAHTLRLALSALSIVLGIGFVSGTFTFSETTKASFFAQFARQARGVDAAVLPGQPQPAKADGGSRPLIPESVPARLRGLDGAVSVEGRMLGSAPLLDRTGRPITNGETAGVAVDVPNDPRLRTTTTVSGRLPESPGEAVLDRATAEHSGFHLGDTLTVLGGNREHIAVHLVGVVDFGVQRDLGSSSVLGLRPGDFTAITGVAGYSRIDIAGGDGVGQQALVARVRDAVGPGYRVMTGDQLRHDLADGVIHNVDSILLGLLMFAFVSVVVAALVIYNTFTILVTQRIREFALLRCVGATRAQILRAVMLESLIVGLVASAAGSAAGLGIAAVLRTVFSAVGTAVPYGALVVSIPGLVIGVGLGVVATVVSALLPALSATRVTPVSALRTLPEGQVGNVARRRLRTAFALALTSAGLGLGVAGLDRGRSGLYYQAVAGTVFFLGVLVAGPLLVGPLTRVIGWLPGRLGGVPGKLAGANARRAPGRAATTTAALTIGVGLMTLFSVVGASAKTFSADQIDTHYPVDYLVEPVHMEQATRQTGVPSEIATRLRTLPEIAAVAQLRVRPTGAGRVAAIDPGGYEAAYRPQMVSGSLERLRDGSGIAAVSADLRKRTGDTLTVDGHVVTIVGVFSGNFAGEQVIVPWADFGRYFGAGDDDEVLVIARKGVPASGSRAALDRAVRDQPLLKVTTVALYKEQLASAVDTVLALFAGLLGIAVVIALFGIANTLSLSVLERTRESALLRALGLTRRQLRLMFSVEALITGVMGGVIGIVIGVGFGWLVSQTFMRPQGGGRVTYPVGQMALYLLIAALAALAASILPARRAARVSPARTLA
jgi:putative ABC transport system permease protein